MEEHFNDCVITALRNKKIKEAIFGGYKQSEISNFLKISPTTVSKVNKIMSGSSVRMI